MLREETLRSDLSLLVIAELYNVAHACSDQLALRLHIKVQFPKPILYLNPLSPLIIFQTGKS